MFETSKDLLFLVIAFCILWLTIFTCWALYYVAQILKGLKEKSDRIDDVSFKSIKNKVESFPALFAVFSEGARQVISYLKEKKCREEKKKKRRNGKRESKKDYPQI